jgi:hypothetical protein
MLCKFMQYNTCADTWPTLRQKGGGPELWQGIARRSFTPGCHGKAVKNLEAMTLAELDAHATVDVANGAISDQECHAIRRAICREFRRRAMLYRLYGTPALQPGFVACVD